MDPLDPDRVRRERDLYLRLLEIQTRTGVDGFVADALGLLTEAVGAKRGYLELGVDDDTPFSLSHGFSESELSAVRRSVSRGIMAEAVATGQTVRSASALTDPRFEGAESVRRNRIEGVICAPVGHPPVGVVYLQGHPGAGPFHADDVALVEVLARHLGSVGDCLLRHRRPVDDPTRPWRQRLHAEPLVGTSDALARVLEQLALVAALDVSVLLTGPTGSGKSAAVRVLHASGRRAAGPLVEVNCAAIPENLLESELFGVVPGAFTGATRRTRGKVDAAHGGTLFLDEVGELPMHAQAKLLQLVQSGTYYKVGDDVVQKADIRLVAATNVDLTQAVAARRFREDLFYRLNVVSLHIPGLDERGGDLDALAEHFCRDACARHGLPAARLTRSALAALRTAQWPGHIRQLANTLESAVIHAQADGGGEIHPRHLFPDRAALHEEEEPTFHASTRRFQGELLDRTLTELDWNVAEAARRLGLARSYLYTLIHEHGLKRR